MTRTTFYAIDQELLDERYWDLADTFAELRVLAGSATGGIARITVADLRLVLDCCDAASEDVRNGPHGNAISRVREAVGPPRVAGADVAGPIPGEEPRA